MIADAADYLGGSQRGSEGKQQERACVPLSSMLLMDCELSQKSDGRRVGPVALLLTGLEDFGGNGGGWTEMATREDFLAHLWTDVIDALSREQGLDNIVANCRRRPDDAFGDVGATIERMLAAGVPRRDLCRVMRLTAYEAVFGTLYALSEPGLDGEEDASTLYEELLMADPSGIDGRPGPTDKI